MLTPGQIYLKYYLVLLLFALVPIVAGYFVMRRRLSFKGMFLSMLVFILLFSSTIALVKTGFVSVMALYVVLGGMLWVETKRRPTRIFNASPPENPFAASPSPQQGTARGLFLSLARWIPFRARARDGQEQGTLTWPQALFAIFIGTFALYNWAYFQYIRPGDFPFVIPAANNLSANDYIINSMRSHFLMQNGEENYFHILNELDSQYRGPKPYHYLEMWLNGGIASIVGGLNVLCNVLVTYPLLYLCSFLGMMGIWEKFLLKNPSWNPFAQGQSPREGTAQARSPLTQRIILSSAKNLMSWPLVIPLLSLPFLFFSTLHFDIYNSWGYYAFSLPALSHRLKMATYEPFILGFLLLYQKEQPMYAWICLLGLFVATVVVGPALGVGILGIAAITLIFKIYPWQQSLRLFVYTLTILLYILLFYALTDSGEINIREDAGSSAVISLMQSKEQVIRLFTQKMDIFQHGVVHMFIMYWPYLLIPLLFAKRFSAWVKSQQFVVPIFYVIVFLIGALAYAYFHPKKDATQLYYNLAIPMMNCAGMVLVVWGVVSACCSFRFRNLSNARPSPKGDQPQEEKLNGETSFEYSGQARHRENNKSSVGLPFRGWGRAMDNWLPILKICLLLFFLTTISYRQFNYAYNKNIQPRQQQHYSQEYLTQIREYVQSRPSPPLGAAIKGGKDYASTFSKQTFSYSLGFYLAYMRNGCLTLSISDFEVPIKSASEGYDVASGLFYQFVEKQKAEGKFRAIEESQVDFVKEFEVDFLVVSKEGEIGSLLKEIIIEKIIDQKSGESFLVLKKK